MTEVIIILFFVYIAVGIIFVLRKFDRTENTNKKKNIYKYTLKPQVITKTEGLFLTELLSAINDNEYIVPQAHLSMFLDHKVYKQNWKAAFSRINGKSVDFLVVEKGSNKPLYAVEVDDFSHTRKDRVERDAFVETILKEAGIPLKRFSNDKRLNYAGVSGNSDTSLQREP